MYRKAQKTRAGCDRCKSRRKKCDEQKPTCANCLRLNLSCTWTPVQARGHTSTDPVPLGTDSSQWHQAVEIKRVARSRYDGGGNIESRMGQGYQPFRDQTQFDLAVWSPTALKGLVSLSAGPEFQDLSALLTMALQNDWLRDAFAAFAAYSMLTMSQGDQKWEGIAMTAYQNALPAVRSHIRASGEDAHSLQTLMAITFLGLSESLGTGDAACAITHFSTAASICNFVPFTSLKTPTERQLYRIAVESWLYNLATLSLVHEDCDSVLRCIDWDNLDACFSSSPAANDLALHLSPFIGGNHGVYKLTIQMTWLARQRASLLVRQAQTSKWFGTLDDLESRLSQFFLLPSKEVARLYHAKYLLHIYALRIYAEKINDHNLTSSSPSILSYIYHARKIFQSQSTQESRNPALGWPLIIFLCAANDKSTFDFLVHTMNEIHINFDTGHTRRMLAVLAIIRWQRARGGDGLDLLLRKRGVLVADEEEMDSQT